jgi:hypothetical protein
MPMNSGVYYLGGMYNRNEGVEKWQWKMKSGEDFYPDTGSYSNWNDGEPDEREGEECM